MKKAVVLAKSEDDFRLIQRCLGKTVQVTHLKDRRVCLDFLRKGGSMFLFVDYEFLEGARWVVEFKAQFRPFWHAGPGVEIILLCHQDFVRGAVYAVIGGAYNYLTYPLNPDELNFVLDSFVEQRQLRMELDLLREEYWQDRGQNLVTVASQAMKEVLKNAQMVAPTHSTVLITGETGSGKSMLAGLIHKSSSRCEGPFISVHCSAIPDSLLESELFGHERGAFTGAIRRKMGKFEAAHGGTLFLDEIGTLPKNTQIKLLQVLQERTFTRVGGEEPVNVDVRVIAATNADLVEMIDDGTFRGDLYYRLNVFPLTVPPLRHRREDIPLLVEFFLLRLNDTYFKEIHDVSQGVMAAFTTYSWPGNIRELENLIERAYILEKTSILRSGSFPSEIFAGTDARAGALVIDTSQSLKTVRTRMIHHVEQTYLHQVLKEHGGNIRKAAAAAGVGVRQLHKLMTRHEINKEDYKPRKQTRRSNKAILPRIVKE